MNRRQAVGASAEHHYALLEYLVQDELDVEGGFAPSELMQILLEIIADHECDRCEEAAGYLAELREAIDRGEQAPDSNAAVVCPYVLAVALDRISGLCAAAGVDDPLLVERIAAQRQCFGIDLGAVDDSHPGEADVLRFEAPSQPRWEATPERPRPRRWPLVAAAAVILAVGGGIAMLAAPDEDAARDRVVDDEDAASPAATPDDDQVEEQGPPLELEAEPLTSVQRMGNPERLIVAVEGDACATRDGDVFGPQLATAIAARLGPAFTSARNAAVGGGEVARVASVVGNRVDFRWRRSVGPTFTVEVVVDPDCRHVELKTTAPAGVAKAELEEIDTALWHVAHGHEPLDGRRLSGWYSDPAKGAFCVDRILRQRGVRLPDDHPLQGLRATVNPAPDAAAGLAAVYIVDSADRYSADALPYAYRCAPLPADARPKGARAAIACDVRGLEATARAGDSFPTGDFDDRPPFPELLEWSRMIAEAPAPLGDPDDWWLARCDIDDTAISDELVARNMIRMQIRSALLEDLGRGGGRAPDGRPGPCRAPAARKARAAAFAGVDLDAAAGEVFAGIDFGEGRLELIAWSFFLHAEQLAGRHLRLGEVNAERLEILAAKYPGLDDPTPFIGARLKRLAAESRALDERRRGRECPDAP